MSSRYCIRSCRALRNAGDVDIREHLQPKVQKLEVYFKLFSFKRTHACCPCENTWRKGKRRGDEKTERKPAISDDVIDFPFTNVVMFSTQLFSNPKRTSTEKNQLCKNGLRNNEQ